MVMRTLGVTILLVLTSVTLGLRLVEAQIAKDGEDSWTWFFEPAPKTQTLKKTPNYLLTSPIQFAPAESGGGAIFNGVDDGFLLFPSDPREVVLFSRSTLSISAWVAVERTQRWGGIFSWVQDNGEAEKGFVLGFDETVFTFGLASEGADDGDGKITYLKGKTPIVSGRWHHVVATYDGKEMRLYVDGKLESQSSEQSGPVLYAEDAPAVLGAYRDSNENHPLDGRLREVSFSAKVLDSEAVADAFAANAKRTQLEPWTDLEFGFLVDPYLTWPTRDGVSILFETTFASTAEVHIRRDDQPAEEAEKQRLEKSTSLHELRVRGLRPDQKYFYQVKATAKNGKAVESPLLSFRTAASPDQAYTFVVVGDTQTNGEVAKRVSDLAYMHRPNFVVHAGDLVDSGRAKSDWTDTFFPSMQPLISRSPLMPVLGNHEQDAPHYYRYMSLPEPERWYTFSYGNADFFMIDGNRSLADQSAQLKWLEQALVASKSTWKFAVLHQPPYTSDSDDYGKTVETHSTRGDMNVRNIVERLERYGVDICFSGHVHDYERTFPIRDGRVTPYEEGGVIYVTAAGGGGSLEDFDPANTWFGHKKARYHHLVYVGIHGKHLEFQAIDEQGRLFDLLTLEKRPSLPKSSR